MTTSLGDRSPIKWQFAEHPSRQRENEPTQEEFFSNESLITEVASIVRESIQNSLDERLDAKFPIRVKFKIGKQPSELSRKYFDELYPHALLVLRGLPEINETGKFLVIEDFNTRGLEGSTASLAPLEDRDEIRNRGFGNSYWYFEWKTGKSNKSSGKRGSWGVGKIVFPRASAIKAYLVLSERRKIAAPENDSCILFGHSILNYRTINDVRYVPDCQWMTTNEIQDFVPSDDETVATEFRKDWLLERKSGELGTSIVIPFVNSKMTASQLLHSIARDYFVTILSGMLVCEVEDEQGKTVILSKDTLVNELSTWDDDLTRDFRSNVEMIDLCNLYIAFLEKRTKQFVVTTPVTNRNDAKHAILEGKPVEGLAEEFDRGMTLEVTFDTQVPGTKDGLETRNDSFVVLLKRAEEVKSSTVFSREGILIPGANKAEMKGLLSIVLVGKVGDSDEQQNTLATLLKNAEGPSHEKWTVTASHFKGIYTPEDLAHRTVAWVKNSVQVLHRMIRQSDSEVDTMTLSKFFPEPNQDGYNPPDDHPGDGPEKLLKKMVTLRAIKSPGNSRLVELKWNNVNVSQESGVGKTVKPHVAEIFQADDSSRSSVYRVPNGLDSITFQVEIAADGKIYHSNLVTVTFGDAPNGPELVAETSGSQLVIRPADASLINSGMKFLVDIGYAVRGGSTFSSAAEFDLVAIEKVDKDLTQGAEIRPGTMQNQILIIVERDDFEIWLKDFNPLLDPAIKTEFQGGVK